MPAIILVKSSCITVSSFMPVSRAFMSRPMLSVGRAIGFSACPSCPESTFLKMDMYFSFSFSYRVATGTEKLVIGFPI